MVPQEYQTLRGAIGQTVSLHASQAVVQSNMPLVIPTGATTLVWQRVSPSRKRRGWLAA